VAKAYHIVQWDTRYENHETRKIKDLTFYAKPNKLIGEGIGATLQEPDNVALLGTWALIEALASTSGRDVRGWLIRNGTAMTAARMAALTRVEVKHFTRALDWFCRPEVNWLEFKEHPALPGESPAVLPPKEEHPALPGESPAVLPQERERERGRDKRETRERGTHSAAARALATPTGEEIKAWAEAAGVDPEFAYLKIRQAEERDDFAKPGWGAGKWQKKLARFWEEDGETWTRKNKKNAAAPGARPDGWMAGDQAIWWTDAIQDVRAACHGAALQDDKKTAARISQIIALREKK